MNKYSDERKYKVAKTAIEMKKGGTTYEELSIIFEIPKKTIEKWILYLKTGKIKEPPKKKKQSGIENDTLTRKDIQKLIKEVGKLNSYDSINVNTMTEKMTDLIECLKQTNIRFDHFYKAIVDEKEIKELAESICEDK